MSLTTCNSHFRDHPLLTLYLTQLYHKYVYLPGIVSGGKVIATGASTDGQKHLDPLALAVVDVATQRGATVVRGVAVASEVDLRGLAVAERHQKTQNHEVVVPRIAGIG